MTPSLIFFIELAPDWENRNIQRNLYPPCPTTSRRRVHAEVAEDAEKKEETPG
jgi:hypothetical protein